MTDEEIMETYEKMKAIFGDALPHPEHEPIRFAYYVKIYKHYHTEEQPA